MKNIDSTAKINDSKIGEDTYIGCFTNIYGSKIGESCKIGSFVEIQKDSFIGNKVIISSHSFICSLVEIQDNVFIGHGVMTVNDLHPPSKKRTGSDNLWRKTLIKKGAVIGSNSTILPVIIGENSLIGAGSVVTKNIPDNEVWAGNPARFLKKLR